MGKLYFNPKNGEFFEASRRKRKPPSEDFVEIAKIDRRFYKAYYASAFCKDCNMYHAVVRVNQQRWVALYNLKYLEYTAKYGCKTARKLIEVGACQKLEFYEFLEKLVENGLFEFFYNYFTKYKLHTMRNAKMRRKLCRLFKRALEDKSVLNKIEAKIVSEVV